MPGWIARSIAAFGAAGFVVLGASGAPAKDTTIAIKDNYFATPYVLVTVGNEVRWFNSGSGQHTVVSYPDSPRAFDSSPGTENGNCTPLLGSADCLEPGSEFFQALRKAGTYKYYCKVAGHADPSVDPDPEVRNGREQPCGMCGILVVLRRSSPPKLVRQTESPQPSSTVSTTPTPSDTVSATASPDATDSPLASGETPPVAAGGSGGQLVVALAAIVALSGLGFLVWQRFLAPR